jgi:hypothetical protein
MARHGYRSAKKAIIITMGLSNIHNPKEGHNSAYHHQFLGHKRIVRRPYPIPKISTILQKLESFTYATTLDLNIVYYTIRLNPRAVEMFTIIFPWGTYSYLRLPMGYAGSADIFQPETMKLMNP